MSNVNNEYLISTFGDIMLDRGFTSIPNTLIYYRKRLGLTASEFEFIIAIISLSWRGKKEIRDKDISPQAKHYYRQKQSLQAKGYLNFSVRNIYKENRFVGIGTVYDLSGLKLAIEKLVEEDRAIKNMDAPVEQKYDEPSLFGEDINREALQPRKLIKKEKTEEQKREDEEAKQFLDKYNKYHKDLLGFEINYRTRTRYKKYLLDAFHKRLKNINIEEALILAKNNFLELPLNKRESLKFQDLVRMALTQKIDIKNEPNNVEVTTDGTSENKINKDNNSIPNGIDNFNKLLQVIEKKGDINETYKTITNTA